MAREIKFRAWDGRTMFNVDVMGISPCTWGCPDYGKRGISLAYQPYIAVMQYTGLKDKNGKEIYEGDILHSDSMYESLFGNPIVRIGEYIDTDLRNLTLDETETFPLYGVYIETKRGIAGIADDCTSEYFKVIGNIYEDKEKEPHHRGQRK